MGQAIPEVTDDRRRLSQATAAIIGIGFLASLVMLLLGVSFLSSWSDDYGGRGDFVVEGCAIGQSRFFGQVKCRGRLVPDDGQPPHGSEMIGPEPAFGSERPSASETVEVYFQPGNTTRAYPIDGRMTELARAIVGIFPTLLLVGGTGAWLIGWLLTRNVDPSAVEDDPYGQRFPFRFGLRPRGAAFALFGALWWLGDRLLVDDLLGTVHLS